MAARSTLLPIGGMSLERYLVETPMEAGRCWVTPSAAPSRLRWWGGPVPALLPTWSVHSCSLSLPLPYLCPRTRPLPRLFSTYILTLTHSSTPSLARTLPPPSPSPTSPSLPTPSPSRPAPPPSLPHLHHLPYPCSRIGAVWTRHGPPGNGCVLRPAPHRQRVAGEVLGGNTNGGR